MMSKILSSRFLFLVASLPWIALVTLSRAFSPPSLLLRPTHYCRVSSPLAFVVSSTGSYQQSPLQMSDDGESESSNSEEPSAEATGEDEVTEEEPEAAPEKPAEDPEITAIKKEIEQFEAQVKETRRQVNEFSDRADDYSKTGYARKVAEMENMRRARSMLNSSNRSSATASILTDFLPVLDKLFALREKYSDDEFGKQYDALPGAMKTAFVDLGVSEYSVAAAEKVDTSRVMVIDSQYSDSVPKDHVIEPLKGGLELQGNIVRMAECVASLGPEGTDEEEEEEEEEEGAEVPEGEEAEAKSGDE